ncbi:hypothetical protein TGRH88_048690 [Toxoplasma gondii]|uniref:Sodium:solute symporter family domain protein n=1 Tax=Toxoplasma gondii TaxID=5811 RepID=A0A7J6JW47_TOXGO|nr:hypothetical protein TGRH88_048690 [Toxoplasma gondii]
MLASPALVAGTELLAQSKREHPTERERRKVESEEKVESEKEKESEERKIGEKWREAERGESDGEHSTKRHNIDASRSSSASPWKACEVGWEERSRWLGSERWRAEARDVEQEETGQGAQEKTGVAGNRGPCDGGFPDLKESQKKRRHFVAPPKRKDREERGGRRDWTECEHGEARLDAVQGDGAAEAVAWMQGQDETKRQLETLLPTTKHVALWLNALAGHLERMQRRQNQQPNRVEMRVADAPQGGLWQLLFDAAAAAKATCEKTHAVANKEMSSSSGHGKESTSGHRQSQGRLPTLRLPSSLSPSSISPSSSARSSSPASACRTAGACFWVNWEAAAQEMNEQDASLLVHACATAELFFPPLFSALSLRLQARRTLPPLANRLPTSSEETSSREEDAKPNKDRENRDDSGTPRPTDLPSSLPSKEMAASSPPPAKHHQHASLGTERLPALSDAGAQSATTTPAGREEVDFLSSFSPQGLSLLLHGFAALRVSLPPTLASRLARSALDKLHATSLAEATEKTERRQAGRMEEAGRGAVAGAVNGRRDAWLGSGVQKAEEERQRSLAPASHGPDFQGSQMKTTRPDGGAGEAGKGTDAGGQSRKTGEVSGVCTPKQAVRLVYALCELPDVPHPLAKHAAVLLSQGRLKTHPESFSIQGRLLALRCFLNFDVREPEGMHAIFLSLLCRGVPRSSGAMSASSAPFVCSSSPASLFSEQHFALLLHLLATAQATGALVFDSSSGKKISVSHPKSPLLADAKSRLLADQPLGDPTVSGLDAPAAARAPGVPSGQVSLFSLLPQFLRTHLAHFLPVATPQGLSSVFSAVAKLDAGRTVLHVNNRLLPLSGEEPLHIRGDRGGVLYADSLLAASCSRLLLSNRAEPRHLIACCFAAAASFAGTPHWHAALLFHAFHVPVAGRALAAGVCTPGRGHGAAAGEKMEQLRDASAVCASADGETSTITWPAKFVQPSLFSLLTCHSETQARNSTGAGVSFHSFTTPASESQLPHRLKAPDNVQWATAVFRGQTQSTEAGDAACCLSSASSNVVADEKRQKQGESPISEGRELQRGSRGHPVLAADRSACFQTGFSTTETINVTTTVQALSACGVTVQTVSQLQAVLLHLAFELGDIGGLSALHLRVLRASISILDYFLHTSLPYDQMRDEPLDDGRKPSKSLLECPDTKSDLPTFVGEHLSSLSPSYDREVCGKHVSSFDSCETDGGSQPHPAMQQACPRSPIKSQGNVCKAKLRGCGNDGNAIGEVSPHYPDLQSLSKRVKSSRLHCEVLDTVRSVVRVERKCESHGNTLKHPMQKVGPCLMVSEALIPPYVVDIAVLPVNRYRGSCNWV